MIEVILFGLAFTILSLLLVRSFFAKSALKRMWVLFELSKKFRSKKQLSDILFESLELIIDSIPDFKLGIILTWDDSKDLRIFKMYHTLFGKIDTFEINKDFLEKIDRSKNDFRIDVKRENSFSDSRIIKSKYLHIFKLAEGGGAFIFGSDKRSMAPPEYQFVRILVDHSSFGLQSRRLLRKISNFAQTIDVLEYTYQRIVDNLPLGVVGLDTNKRVALWNDLMEDMFGIKEEEILEKFIQDIFPHEDNQNTVAELIDSIQASDKVQEVKEMHFTDKYDTKKVFLILGYQLKDETRKINGSILVFRDITENFVFEEEIRKARKIKEQELTQKVDLATQELQHANIELKNLNSLKSEFVSVVSHELRTPLTSIRGYASLLLSNKMGELEDKQKESVGIIKSEGERLSNLINDLLDLSRLESGKTTLAIEKTNISQIIESVTTSLSIQSEPKEIDLQNKTKKKLMAYVDGEKIRQVLYNIIGNAIKFTPEKGKIVIKAEENKEFITLIIRDTGIGISDADLSKLFEPFSQVESHLKRSTPGSGLGLTISKHIVEMHQGEIRVESKPGKGSTFFIIIPKNRK